VLVRFSREGKRDSVLHRELLNRAYPTSTNAQDRVVTKNPATGRGLVKFSREEKKDSVLRLE